LEKVGAFGRSRDSAMGTPVLQHRLHVSRIVKFGFFVGINAL
jgi:hypothetical protein